MKEANANKETTTTTNNNSLRSRHHTQQGAAACDVRLLLLLPVARLTALRHLCLVVHVAGLALVNAPLFATVLWSETIEVRG
jgi:hypothetical protein